MDDDGHDRQASCSGYAVKRLPQESMMTESPRTGSSGQSGEVGNGSRQPSDDSAQARMDKYAKDQQGLQEWTGDTIRSYAAAIGLALEFDDRRANHNQRADEKTDPLPSDEKLRAELQRAGKEFDKSPAAMWRVLKKYYRASEEHLDALAKKFVNEYEADLREANDRRRLGETDDDDEPDTNAETQPLKTRAKEAIAEMVKETRSARERGRRTPPASDPQPSRDRCRL